MKKLPRVAACFGFVVACGGAPTLLPRAVEPTVSMNPLGPSYFLMPAPSEDVSLVGRVIMEPPRVGHALDEVAQPNPCASELEEVIDVPMSNAFEAAEELAMGASASAALKTFGFSADVSRATHFAYKLATDRQVLRRDTSAYVECCRVKECGYGYVSTLVHAEGEYYSASEERASGSVNVGFAEAQGFAGLDILSRRRVQGFVAAQIRVHPGQVPARTTALGVLEKQVALSATDVEYKQMFERERVWVSPMRDTWAFATMGRGTEASYLTENEFVRRFESETRRGELTEVERHRNKGAMWTGVGLALLSVPIAVGSYYAFTACERNAQNLPSYVDEEPECSGPIVGGGVIGALALSGGFGLAASSSYDGDPEEHVLTESDARYYADQYNRALLRRLVRDAERGQQSADGSSSFDIDFVVGPVMGVTGTF